MNVETQSQRIIQWIKEKVEDAGAKGCVFGLSGGIDSAVVAGLCKRAFPEGVLGLIMPCHSNPIDEKMALLAAEEFEIPVEKIVLDETFDTLMKAFKSNPSERSLAVANIKPRLRMLTLYYFASKNNFLVIGTGNKSELTVGYFTKYGDSGVDLLPLGNLVKTQVRELAKYLGVPKDIIQRPPTAGLWEGQTDESEMGITYEELDKYILTGQGEERVKMIVDSMNKKSEHKRKLPPIPVF
ncbi:MAG: synthase [Thermosediminibacterales bacterium]|nr:synthase [Thermosediminibacterales bacterium]